MKQRNSSFVSGVPLKGDQNIEEIKKCNDFSVVKKDKHITVRKWMKNQLQTHYSAIKNPQKHSKSYNSTLLFSD